MRPFSANQKEPRIVHEMPKRIRIRGGGFHDPAFDPAYLEALLMTLPGVTRVRFNLKTTSVVVGYDGDPSCREAVLRCVGAIPGESYRSAPRSDDPPDPVGAGVKTVLALLTPAFPKPARALLGWSVSLSILLKGLETLVTRGVKVEVLDAAAVGFSLLRGDFFTANSVAALLALGEYLEQISEDKSNGLLKSLLRPQMETVWVMRDGRETRLRLEDVKIGDLVVCGAGEMIPVDGVVVEGDASVNQSAITGESVPVHLAPGSDALSGSVVEEGRIQIDARRVGRETGMARVGGFLERSLRDKSPSRKESDRLADRLAPATLALGVGLYLATRDVRRAAAVLTVDYSCALKLANPVAVRTAMYTAAHGGALLKGAQALDALAGVDTMVFDKTGTLTLGVPEVADVVPMGDMTPDDLLALAAGAEEHYAHPVARAVTAAAKRRGLAPPAAGQVDFIVAHGVSAYVNGERVLVGSHHFIGEDEGLDCRSADRIAEALRTEGKSLLYVAREDVLEGVIALRDALRPEAAGVIRDLKALGIRKTVMLTGDHPDTARSVGERLSDLDEIHWDLKPEDKAAIVKDLRSRGCRIAFAGDGVNDAPALVAAEVGVCMPGGADLAREAAQVILLRDDLNALVAARQIAIRTRNTLQHCFGATLGLNTLFLLLAGTGRLPPVTAALLHNVNTVGILGYAAAEGMREPDALSTA